MKLLTTLLLCAFPGTIFAAPDAVVLKEGKALYEGAGSCVACHMADGKGQPGSVPPLKGSDWLDNPDRTIAIILRGIAGPIKVNKKRYHSMMPPQLLFNDEAIATMVTYVNNAWGNKGPAVSAGDVAKARKSLPQGVYTPEALLEAFPFSNKKKRANGTYQLDFDDTLSNVSVPVIYRTFMPGASPAAFAVALPGDQFFCWDAGECRLRYVWTKGGFIRGNKIHWSSNGKPVAQFSGIPYYKARSSLLKPEDEKQLANTQRKTPFYDTSEAVDFPIKIKGVDGAPSYKGYRLVKGFPEFRYQLGKHEIRELIQTSPDKTGIIRSFSVNPQTALNFRLTPSKGAATSSSSGTIGPDGTLSLTAKQADAFQITILEKEPLVPATTKKKAAK